MKKYLIALLSSVGVLFGCSTSQKFESVDAKTFGDRIADKEVQIVDVRTPEEYNEGHIPGAVNMDVQGADFASQIATLDKERPVAIYCRSGRRSKRAAQQMSEIGLKVTELEGGILSWKGEVTK